VTADQRRAIESDCARLVALYANLNDAARWEELAGLYVEDGKMSRPSAPDDFIVGRQAIRQAFEARPPRLARHVCSNVVIDVESAELARGESAMVLFRSGEEPLVGSFHDHFVLTSDGWRFAERRGSLAW
jgi:hypothetical protein